MKTRIFTYAAIAAMCAMPIISNAEDKTVGERVDKALDKVGDAVTPDKALNDATMAPAFPAGIATKENGDIADVRGALTTIVNRTLTRDGLDGAIAYLANQDRDRIKAQLKDTEYEGTLNGRVDQIRGLFKQKYGEDFELTAAALNTSTAVQQGEVTDAATARANWPLAIAGKKDVKPMSDAQTDKKDAKNDAMVNDDPKLENGRDVAVVRVAPMPGKEPLILSLQYELPNYWVLDVSNSISGKHLIKCQEMMLQKIIDSKDDWPKTKDEAYRNIACAVLTGYVTPDDGKPLVNLPRE